MNGRFPDPPLYLWEEDKVAERLKQLERGSQTLLSSLMIGSSLSASFYRLRNSDARVMKRFTPKWAEHISGGRVIWTNSESLLSVWNWTLGAGLFHPCAQKIIIVLVWRHSSQIGSPLPLARGFQFVARQSGYGNMELLCLQGSVWVSGGFLPS